MKKLFLLLFKLRGVCFGKPNFEMFFFLIVKISDAQINTFVAEWLMYALYVQMHRVRNDAYMRHSI